MKERLWLLAAAILLAGCLNSGFVREVSYTPGMYEGSGRGYRGPIHVRLQVGPAGIEDISVISHRESAFPGAAAIEELLEAVMEYGSANLDTISGATFSSRGFLEAVDNALRKARQSIPQHE